MRILALSLAFSLCAASLAAEPNLEWPKWRGPDGDGISKEPNLLKQWPDGGPKRVWKKEVGLGYSSPIALDGKLYVFAGSKNQAEEILYCLDAKTGEEIWKSSYRGGYPGRGYKGTRATPTIEGEFIYTFGGNGMLSCFKLDSGERVWQLDVLKTTGGKRLMWGSASSPVIHGDHIFVQAGNGGSVAVAVNKKTGKIAWQSEAKGASGYAACPVFNVDGTEQLIVFAGTQAIGMNPKTGKTIWTHAHPTKYRVNATTPLFADGKLFLASGYGQGSVILEVKPDGVKELWSDKDVQSRFQGVILHDNVIYTNSEGVMMAIEWPTGKQLWKERRPAGPTGNVRMGNGGSLLMLPDNMMILLTERGDMGLAKVNKEGINLVSRVKNFFEEGTEIWSTPLVYKGKLYAKGMTELICVDISK